MDAKLRNLLENIDPRKIFDDIERDTMNVLNDFTIPKNKIESREEVIELLVDFELALFGLPLEKFNDVENHRRVFCDMACNQCKKIYGDYNIAIELMLSGAEGGVYGVIKNMAKLSIDDRIKNKIEKKVQEYFWDSLYDDNGLPPTHRFYEKQLSMEKQMKAADEYLEEFKDILPISVKDNPSKIRINFRETLINHSYMIGKLRNIGY